MALEATLGLARPDLLQTADAVAREKAIDGGSADEKSAIFKKYKGRINNYLSTQGIDMKQAEKAWGQKQKQQQAATKATQPAGDK